MLKLLIVDDEEIICRTIANLIDWDSLGITLVGTCLDGVEAYHAILDETPDIVMTDIRMPGIGGLELIERVARTDLNTQFIILSGYGEFDYAKRAMKCGVRHYLLKPCEEDQIVACIKEISEDCIHLRQLREAEHQNSALAKVQKTLIQNLISEGVGQTDISSDFFSSYEPYLDLSGTAYQYCNLYFLERDSLKNCLSRIQMYFQLRAPQLVVHKIYVSHALVLFFPDFCSDYRELDEYLASLSFPQQAVAIQYERKPFPELRALCQMLIAKLRRFDVLYFADDLHLIPNFNYEQITRQVNALIPALRESDTVKMQRAAEELRAILRSVTSRPFLLQLTAQLLVSLSAQISSWEISDISDFLSQLHQETELSAICSLVMDKLGTLTKNAAPTSAVSPFIQEIQQYLNDHVADENLTLKWIAENHLYMNVNYVSRCFVKEMHQTFSSYFTNLKIQKAKEILRDGDAEKIQNVAKLVGCGNNPYYFSKLFKKVTGMTPTAYIKKQAASLSQTQPAHPSPKKSI